MVKFDQTNYKYKSRAEGDYVLMSAQNQQHM